MCLSVADKEITRLSNYRRDRIVSHGDDSESAPLDDEAADVGAQRLIIKESRSLLPTQLISILEDPSKWSESESNDGGLNLRWEKTARCLYSKTHQNLNEYYHLYNYFALRYPTKDHLKKYTSVFQNWEFQIHDKYPDHCRKNHEVLKCWRLHLGSTKLLKSVIESTTPSGRLDRIKLRFKRFQNAFRRKRQALLYTNGICAKCFESSYKMILRVFCAFRPFLNSFLLYFETLKNVSFAYLIWTSLRDLKTSDNDARDLGFETSLLGFLVAAILLTQLIFVMICSQYLSELMPFSCNWSRVTEIVLRTGATVLGPITPTFALANIVHFGQKEYLIQRELQVPKPVENNNNIQKIGLMSNSASKGVENSHTNDLEHQDSSTPDNEISIREDLYRKALHLRYHKKSNIQLYTYFRVVSASIESYVAIVILILIFTCDNGEAGTLSNAISQRLKLFWDIRRRPSDEDKTPFAQHFYNSKLWLFVAFISYSFLMMTTSIVKYVNVTKDDQMGKSSRLFLFLYIACHLITRITLAAAIYVTPHLASNSENTILISKVPATIFGVTFFLAHFFLIFWYKFSKIEAFRNAKKLEQLIHVLVNTLVIVPFHAPWNSVIHELLHTNDFNFVDKKKQHQWQHEDYTCYVNEVQNDGVSKIRLTEVNKNIEKMWWKKTKRKLNFEDIKKALLDDANSSTTENVFDYLCDNGYINKTFYCPPRQTKQEFFWLFILHLMVNGLSLVIEWCNGGISTSKGRYISWDIRLGSYGFGLIFLWIYYRRYHLVKFLSSARTLRQRLKQFCLFIFKEQENVMEAIPNSLFEENMDLNCSNAETNRANQSQTTMTVHVGIESMNDITMDPEDNSVVTVTGRFKHLGINTSANISKDSG